MFKWRTDKEFHTMTICSADLTLQGQKKKKKAAGLWKRLNLHLQQLKLHLFQL